jgi:rhodanese-related sulfurtransferase
VSGLQVGQAGKKLGVLGFGRLCDLAPGFDGWKKALKPVEK